jgi:phytochrome-interacting factor 4
MNSSGAMNPMYVANQMQNIHLRKASNHFLHSDGAQAAAPQVQKNHSTRVPMFPVCTRDFSTLLLYFMCSPSLDINSLQVAGPYAYAPQLAPQNRIPEVPDSNVVPTCGPGQPPTSDGI